MKQVAKYNTYKGVSTILTMGTPIATLAACGDMFIHRSETSISAAGVFALLIVLLFVKDKIIEYFKAPSAAVLSAVCLVLVILIENIIIPIKYVCITTLIMSGVDEITFKSMYKKIEIMLPENTKLYKKVGFIFTTTEKLLKESNNEKHGTENK